MPALPSSIPLGRSPAGSSLGARVVGGGIWRWMVAAGGVYLALLAAHWPLLHLPYYWDEAGYFIPAALDLFRHGWWIPRSTLANGHPPLLMAVLAVSWHLFGASIAGTRATVLAFGAALLLGEAQLVKQFASRRAAWLAAVWLALTPLVFAQATLAQLDLPAAALVIWAWAAWSRGRRWWYAGLAAAACLTKETAILTPLVLGLWALASLRRGGKAGGHARGWWAALGPHLIPVVPLAAWFAYYHSATGFWMGNAGFLAYNLPTAHSPARIGMALGLRIWQLIGYDGMAAITIAGILAGWWGGTWRGVAGGVLAGPKAGADAVLRRQLGAIVGAYLVFHAVVGGAVLDRYLLPAIAAYVALLAPLAAGVSRRWVRRGLLVAVAGWLVGGWFWNPPYPFPYEDNLAYASFVRLQQRAVAELAARRPAAPVLTAWPATNELTNPSLGYVAHPLAVAPVENFSAAALAGRRLGAGQYALLYSRIYQPRRDWLRRWPLWLRWKRRYFHYRPPLTARQLLVRLHARMVWRVASRGQWALLARGRPAGGRAPARDGWTADTRD